MALGEWVAKLGGDGKLHSGDGLLRYIRGWVVKLVCANCHGSIRVGSNPDIPLKSYFKGDIMKRLAL